MAKAATQSPDDFRNLTPTGVNMPSRDLVNNNQIQVLLGCINTYAMFLTNMRTTPEGGARYGGESDGGAVMAAENSFIKLCDRMDVMVADNNRWGFTQQDTLENSLLGVHQAHRDFLTEQRIAVAKMKAPHIRFHPELVRLDDGTWAAYYGDPNTPSCIIGTGDCPESAIANFDEVFAGKIDYEKQQTEQQAAVDGARSGIPENQPEPQHGARTSRRTKPVNKIRKRKTRTLAKPKPKVQARTKTTGKRRSR